MIHMIKEIMKKNKIMFLITICIVTCIIINIFLLYQYLTIMKTF